MKGILKRNTEINQKKLKKYLKEERIIEFSSDEECMEYFNTCDGQNFININELKEYQGKYGFNLEGKRYHINYDDALDVYIK